MPAMSDLMSLGDALLKVRGLNPQRLTTMSEARVPGAATWAGMDYQATGLGEGHTRIECVTYPHVIGGLDALALLQTYHEGQTVVNYIRIKDPAMFLGRCLGRVRIRTLYVEEEKLHWADGVGRKVGVEMDLVFVGGLPMDNPPTPISGPS